MAICPRCTFIFNAAFDPALMSYDEHYDNTQTYSPEFRAHVEGLVQRIVARAPQEGSVTIVEVGCGKGDFIRRLVSRDPRLIGYGFDPTYVGADEDLNGRLRFEKRFYDAAAMAVEADVVISRHVIEHVPDPLSLLRAVRRAVARRTEASICFETPDVQWILEHGVPWDFFYEHCSLFSMHSLSAAFNQSGFNVASVERVFGNQYLWLEARTSDLPATNQIDSASILELAANFAAKEQRLYEEWTRLVRRAEGIAVWGAGAKGVTFANLVDRDCRDIGCFIDVNPSKQGKFVAGTGHLIVAPSHLSGAKLDTVVVLNPKYTAEITSLVRELGSAARVVDFMELLA